MKLLAILMVSFMANAAMAQIYEMKGNFSSPQSHTPVNFKLRWTENEKLIQGNYSDNFYTNAIPFTGAVGDGSRIFRMSLKSHPKGLGTITIVSSQNKSNEKGLQVPVSIVAQDSSGNPLMAEKSQASLSMFPNREAQEERSCVDDFGELAGFCGIYRGLISEDIDPNKKCSLASGTPPELELDPKGNLLLHLGPVSNMLATPVQRIGRIPSDIGTTIIDVMSRACRPLTGTTFKGDDCKRINLVGTFSEINQTKHFTGAYIIVNEKNENICTYKLSLDRIAE